MSEQNIEDRETLAQRRQRAERRLTSRLDTLAYDAVSDQFNKPGSAGVQMRLLAHNRRDWLVLGLVSESMPAFRVPTTNATESISGDPDHPQVGYRVKTRKLANGVRLGSVYTRYKAQILRDGSAVPIVEEVTTNLAGQVVSYDYFVLGGGYRVSRQERRDAIDLDSDEGSIATQFLERLAEDVYGQDLSFEDIFVDPEL